jgi:hypothetical protein
MPLGILLLAISGLCTWIVARPFGTSASSPTDDGNL